MSEMWMLGNLRAYCGYRCESQGEEGKIPETVYIRASYSLTQKHQIYLQECFPYMCVFETRLPSAHEGQKRAADPWSWSQRWC